MTPPGPRAPRSKAARSEDTERIDLRRQLARLRKLQGKRPGGHALRGSVARERSEVLRRDQAARERCKGYTLRRPKGERPPCLAKTRAGGRCKAPCAWVKGEFKPRDRCRLHGGTSTGPRTDAGRARIAAAQRERWARWRAARAAAGAPSDDQERPSGARARGKAPT